MGYRTVFFGLMLALLAFAGQTAAAEQTVVVDFSTATLQVVTSDGVTLFSTKVVLPGGDYYTLPVAGVVKAAIMGPSWTPTANTRASHPGKYKASYGPYEKGNAMGYCKITINFDRDETILQSVRIHGNAKAEDLGERHSRGCVRIPDAVCSELVDQVNGSNGVVHILFQP